MPGVWSVGVEAQMPHLRTGDEDERNLFKVRPLIPRLLLHLQRLTRRISERQRKPGRNAGRGSREVETRKNRRVGERGERFDQLKPNARACGEGIVTGKT